MSQGLRLTYFCPVTRTAAGLLVVTALATLLIDSAGAVHGGRGLIALGLQSYDKTGHPVGRSIWIAEDNGAGLHRLTSRTGVFADPALSPDGRKIACDGAYDIFVMNANGTGRRKLTFDGDSYEPRWSPDGNKIVYTHGVGDSEIRIIEADGSHARRVHFRGANFSEAYDPDWAPDGRQLAFVGSKPTGDGLTARSIYVASTDGSGLRKITAFPSGNLSGVRWSPDGRSLLVVGESPLVVSVEDKGRRSFQVGPFLNVASWSPDGRQIVYAASGAPLRILSIKTGRIRTVPVRLTDEVDSLDWRRLPQKR